MKAKCSCGYVFDVGPDQEGKVEKCPQCGKRVRMPGSVKPATRSFLDDDIDLEKDLDFGPLAGGVGPDKAPQPEAAPPPEAAADFDWGDEFALEEPEEPEPGTPEPAAPAPEPPAQQAEEPAAGADLQFDSQEFSLETGEEADDEAPIELGPGQIISARKGQAAPPADAPAAETPTKICPECGRIVTEFVGQCPECGAALRAEGGGRPASGPQRPGREQEQQPRTIFGLMAICMRRLSVVADIGVGGIAGGSMRLQIVGAFLLMVAIGVVAQSVGKVALKEGLKEGLKTWEVSSVGLPILEEFVSFVGVVFAMYLVASMVRKSAKFLDIMFGLMFVRVMATLALLVVVLVGGAFTLVSASLGAAIMGATTIIYLGFVVMLQIYFVMGVFDMGCFGAIMLSVVTGWIQFFILAYLSALLEKIGLLNGAEQLLN